MFKSRFNEWHLHTGVLVVNMCVSHNLKGDADCGESDSQDDLCGRTSQEANSASEPVLRGESVEVSPQPQFSKSLFTGALSESGPESQRIPRQQVD